MVPVVDAEFVLPLVEFEMWGRGEGVLGAGCSTTDAVQNGIVGLPSQSMWGMAKRQGCVWENARVVAQARVVAPPVLPRQTQKRVGGWEQACLVLVEARETRYRVQWYYKLFEATQKGLSKLPVNLQNIHGSLLALGELLRHTGRYPHFLDPSLPLFSSPRSAL